MKQFVYLCTACSSTHEETPYGTGAPRCCRTSSFLVERNSIVRDSTGRVVDCQAADMHSGVGKARFAIPTKKQ